jgi:lysophospholipase L1-like esterase
MQRNYGKIKIMKNSKLLIGLIALFAVFAGVMTAFYINRDEIYYFLNKDANTSKIREKTPDTASRPISPAFGGAVPRSDEIPEPYGYFSNIAFIGDSIMFGFDGYRDSIEFEGEKVLRDAFVAASVGYGLRDAVSGVANNSVNLIYGGKAMRPEDILAERSEKYVFLCLGLNDLGFMTAAEYIEAYKILIDNIQKKNPDKTVVILSVTPLVAGQGGKKMDNGAIAEANNMLLEYAAGCGIQFLDWAAAVRGEDESGLCEELSSDGYCHLKIEAYNRLVKYLLEHPVE